MGTKGVRGYQINCGVCTCTCMYGECDLGWMMMVHLLLTAAEEEGHRNDHHHELSSFRTHYESWCTSPTAEEDSGSMMMSRAISAFIANAAIVVVIIDTHRRHAHIDVCGCNANGFRRIDVLHILFICILVMAPLSRSPTTIAASIVLVHLGAERRKLLPVAHILPLSPSSSGLALSAIETKAAWESVLAYHMLRTLSIANFHTHTHTHIHIHTNKMDKSHVSLPIHTKTSYWYSNASAHFVPTHTYVYEEHAWELRAAPLETRAAFLEETFVHSLTSRCQRRKIRRVRLIDMYVKEMRRWQHSPTC